MRYVLPLMILLTGCATMQGLPVEERTQLYEASYDDVFRAAVGVLTASGYAVTTADREAGIITTDYLSNSGLEAALIGGQRQKITIIIAPEGEATRATATIALESTNAFGGTSSQIVTKEEARKLYRELFAVIGQTASAYAQEE